MNLSRRFFLIGTAAAIAAVKIPDTDIATPLIAQQFPGEIRRITQIAAEFYEPTDGVREISVRRTGGIGVLIHDRIAMQNITRVSKPSGPVYVGQWICTMPPFSPLLFLDEHTFEIDITPMPGPDTYVLIHGEVNGDLYSETFRWNQGHMRSSGPVWFTRDAYRRRVRA